MKRTVLLTILLLSSCAFLIGKTSAYFSDQAKTTGNTFTAGTWENPTPTPTPTPGD